LLPGARPGHPEAQNAPEPAREAQNGVDSRSGILQTPKELVESPFPLRNQTWKETFCSWTRKPNSYPLSLRIRISCLIRRRKALDFSESRTNLWTQMVAVCLILRSVNVSAVG
jgi:hypothetical protein